MIQRASFLALATALLYGCASGNLSTDKPNLPASQASQSIINNDNYNFCSNEAIDSMMVSRMAMLFNYSKERMLSSPKPAVITNIINDFFSLSSDGKVENYAQFSADRFMSCIDKRHVPITTSAASALSCISRVDIPYFFSLEKASGKPAGIATLKLESKLSGWHYPAGLISSLATPSYKANGRADVRDLELFVFNSCLLPKDEVDKYYGAQ